MAVAYKDDNALLVMPRTATPDEIKKAHRWLENSVSVQRIRCQFMFDMPMSTMN